MTECHLLKCDPEPFEAVLSGAKRYELRRADRDFKVGDDVVLREFVRDRGLYTGRELKTTITWITPGGAYGLPPDLCILGIGMSTYEFVCPF